MIIQCPRCSTRWRVGEPATDNPTFKCGRCHSIFPRFPGAPAAGERPSRGRQRAESQREPDNLEFIFPSRTPAPEPVPAPEVLPESSALDSEVRPVPMRDDAPPEPSAPRLSDSLEKDLEKDLERDLATEADERLDKDFETDVDEPLEHDLDSDMDQDDGYQLDDTIVATPPPSSLMLQEETPMSAAPIYRALFAMVALFGLLTLAARSDPERASDWLATLPVVGPRLTERPDLDRQITLRNVRGGYQSLRKSRRGFVISGEAVNNSLSAVERVEVEATLYDDSDGEVGRKIVITGNKATLRLADLSERAISMLQDFDPHATLAPGESMPFWVVFLEPPSNVKQFSSRVLSVRPTGQASTPPSNRVRNPASVG